MDIKNMRNLSRPQLLKEIVWYELNKEQLEKQCNELVDENDKLKIQVASLEKSLRIAYERSRDGGERLFEITVDRQAAAIKRLEEEREKG